MVVDRLIPFARRRQRARRVARTLPCRGGPHRGGRERITELTGACRRDSGRFRIRMSVSSTDQIAMPENDNELVDVTTEVTEAVEAADTTPQTTFADLGLPEGIVRKLAQNGVTTPFPIQAATIPDALTGKDILGRGRTGSGKTLSFGLPLLTTLSGGGRTERKRPRGIILTPTRELAMQVA